MKRYISRWFVMAILVFFVSACGTSPPEPGTVTRQSAGNTIPPDSPLPPPTDTPDPLFVALGEPYSTRYYTFRPPLNWRVEEGQNGFVTLFSLQDDPLYGKIEMGFGNYDMSPGQSLADWAQKDTERDDLQVNIVSHSIVNAPNGAQPRQIVQTRASLPAGFLAQTLMINHDNIVLIAATYVDDQATMDVMRTMMESVLFHADIPTSVRGIGFWDATSEVVLDNVVATRDAARAETIAHATVAHGTAVASATAEAIAMATRRAEWTLTPVPTMSEEFLSSEATFAALLASSGLLTEVYPTNTPTPQPVMVEAATASGEMQTLRMLHTRGNPDIHLTISTSRWELVGSSLNHRQLPGCRLDFSEESKWIRGSGNGFSSIKTIGNREWHISETPDDKRRSYYTGDFHMSLLMFYTVDRDDPAFAQCRDAVEEVLATWRPAQ